MGAKLRGGMGVVCEARGLGRHQTGPLGDLSLSLDGHHLRPRLVSADFPAIEELKEGLGEIHIEFAADLPRGGPNRKLVLENHHQARMAAYLVNCLVPRDRDIRILAQNRNETQSFYQLDYVAGGSSGPEPLNAQTIVRGWMGRVGLASIFRLGMRHIAEGPDHLLFLLALLLPAPLLASGSRGPDLPAGAAVCSAFSEL
ncbi:MAG TPA: HupE/UreJ family protein [Terriglobia bacterium]|nr:HupE/UreJ family protein [Terriglobia bacterium]